MQFLIPSTWSSIQPKNVLNVKKKKRKMWSMEVGEEQSIEISLAKMLDLEDQSFKSAILNIFKDLTQIMSEELHSKK